MRRMLFLPSVFVLQLFCMYNIGFASNHTLSKTKSNDAILIANLSGVVWFDQNINGMVEEFEFPMPNVPVLLFTCNGQFVNATVSQNNGTYTFNNIPNGSYKVYVSLVNLGNFFSFTIQNESTDNNVNETGYSECIIATDDNFELNAGISIFPIIGDRVWEDLDGDGIQDFGEPGIQGVVVEAFNDELLVADAVTNSEGNYFFNTLLPGNYVFRFLAPEAYIPTKHIPLHPANSKITQNNGPFTTDGFEIQPSADGSLDAGFYRCAKICGILYNDINESDSLNLNENGINGVRINLWQIVNGDTLFYGLTHTALRPGAPSDDGYYEFCVPPGTYFVEIDRADLPDYLPGAPLATNNPETFNHFFEYGDLLSSYSIDLVSNDSYCNINQGFYCSGEIVSKVWLEANQNGLQEISESALEYIQVELRNADGDLIRTSSTDEFGVVSFKTVKKGSYYLHFSIGSTYLFTAPFQGPVLIDSDVNGYFGEGTTPLFDLTLCSMLLGIDAGVSLKPLPLTWLNVAAENISKGINKISWDVAKEVNVSHYLVQKSWNGTDWADITKVPAKGVLEMSQYQYLDRQVEQNNIYYRIQSLDFDGSGSYSEIVYVRSGNQKLQMVVTPNPAMNVVDIVLSDLSENEAASITLSNQMGQKVLEIQQATSLTSVSLDNIPDGIYYVRVKTDNGQQYTQKLVVKK